MRSCIKKGIVLCSVLLLTIALHAQNPNGFEITAKFKEMEDGGKVELKLFGSKSYHSYEKYMTIADTTTVRNGQFHIKGVVPDGLRRYWLNFVYKRDENNSPRSKTIELWIANGENITITADQPLDSIQHGWIEHFVNISGSPTTESWLRLMPLYEFYYQTLLAVDGYMRKTRDSLGFNSAVADVLVKLRANMNYFVDRQNFWLNADIDRQRANLVFLQIFNDTRHDAFWPEHYKRLTEEQKKSFNGKWLQEVARLSIGQPFPEFNLPAPDGKLLSSNDVIKKSKATLIHFWSNNSQGRRIYQDEVRAMYKKYHDKGLNVIFVFHDDTNYERLDPYTKVDVKKQFLDIINGESFPWYNVADWDYKNGPVETLYREGGGNNTTNVIVDAKGKIVAWEAKGLELQYHLWKIFGE